MISIVEQAKQSPSNATPVGWDTEKLCFPGVNTCLTITAVGKLTFGKAMKQGQLVGMHLGLFMGAGQEGGGGSENSTMISDAHLDMYLRVMEQHAWIRGGGASRIYLAGALDVWKQNAAAKWRKVASTMDVWSRKMAAPVSAVAFDDDKSMTVDIYVDRGGVKFTTPGTDRDVPAL